MKIKYSLLRLFPLLAIAAIVMSCDDDKPLVPFVNAWPEENPLPGYMQTTQFYQDETIYKDKPQNEIGFAFKPSVKGNLTALLIKMPDTCKIVRVTVWDKDTATPILTENVDVTAAGVAIKHTIAPLALEKDKAYAITMNVNDWYNRRRFDISSMPFPVTSGNIIVTGSGWGSGSAQVLPENMSRPNYYDGDISFMFRRTE